MSGAVVAEARRWIGTPYVHGASVAGAGADCLGLVRGVYRALAGPELETVPVYTSDWGEAQRDERLWEAARRVLDPADGPFAEGDVLLFRMRDGAVAKHLGILTQAGGAPRFVHAWHGHGVVESALSAPWARRVVARFRIPLAA